MAHEDVSSAPSSKAEEYFQVKEEKDFIDYHQ